MNIREILRLVQMGRSDVEIARLVDCHRQTVAKYRKWAARHEVLAEGLPDEGVLHRLLEETMPSRPPPQQRSSLEEYEQEVLELRKQGVRMTAIQQRLEERHGKSVSYAALKRLVRRLEPRSPKVCVRIEVDPGKEAQVDFGYAGLTLDEHGRERRTWVFIMTLSHSRHMHAELVYDQKMETWLGCHIRAFEEFGGVPERVRPDNLKAGILKHTTEEMEASRAYRELAEHYDFIIDPHAPRRPEHKGKVEKGGVDYVKNTFLAGRDPEPTRRLNRDLAQWCRQEAGMRTHGTTQRQPLVVFESVEKPVLRPLPRERFDLPTFKRVKLQRDCHVFFERAHYSAPYALVGQELLVRGGLRDVRIYDLQSHELLATHRRAKAPGERLTRSEHLPEHKVAGLALGRAGCRSKAEAVGPQTASVVEKMLSHRPENRLAMAFRLLRLAETYSPERLERACERALVFGESEYRTVRRILERGLDREGLPQAPPVPRRTLRFARSAAEYAIGLPATLLRGGTS